MSGAIILSPHLDDAALSAFHELEQGDGLVVTLCAGVPGPGTELPYYDRFTGAISSKDRALDRREEDRAAAVAGGWTVVHLDLLDNIYRTREEPLTKWIEQVAALVPAGSNFWAPAGIGQHPDHVFTRAVGLGVAAKRQLTVNLYADLPYAAYFGWPAWVTGGEADPLLDLEQYYRRALPTDLDWVGQTHQLDAKTQQAKLDVLKLYRSQFPAQEGGPSRWISHPKRLPFEVSWVCRSVEATDNDG